MINTKNKNKMKTKKDFSRRTFVKKTIASGIVLNIIPAYVLGGSGHISPNDKLNISLSGTRDAITWNDLTKDEKDLLNLIEKKAFDFFWETYNSTTGLMGDADVARNRCSIASVGFGLSAFCIADIRGWVNHQEVYDRVLKTLNSFYKDSAKGNDIYVEGTHGLFYHFINTNTGKRNGKSGVSTIDSAILMAGILHTMQHFKGTEIENLARNIYLNAEWDWFIRENGAIAGTWRPETGLTGEYKGYNEYILVYLLGLGSPTHSIPQSSWKVWASGPGFRWQKPYEDIGPFLTPHGEMRPEAYLYQFPACWFDFRRKKDHYADYWENGVNALKANRRICINWGKEHHYPEELWGWTACNGPDGYQGFMHPYNGTIAPSAVAASMPFIPDLSLPTLKYMYDKYSDKIWGKYGFTDAFNPYQNWYDDRFLGIDQGNMVLMLENFRSGMVWKEFMSVPYVKEAMKKAGFLQNKQISRD